MGELLSARAFPLGEMEGRADDLEVAFPGLLERYRVAHGIARRPAFDRASATDLRRAFIASQMIFEELMHRDARGITRM